MSSECLEKLSIHSIGGGWGQEVADEKHTERVAVIRGTDIARIVTGDVSGVPVRWETSSKVKSRLLQPGDIVIEVSGGSAANGQHTGRALFVTDAILKKLGGRVIPASFCRLLRLNTSYVDPRYITYQVAGMHITGEIAEFENQSTGIANFQFSRFLRDVSPQVQDKFTQESAASFLTKLDDRITLLRETNTTLEAIAQAIFKSWFVNFDPVRAKMEGRAPEGIDEATSALFSGSLEESALGLIPKGWRVGSVGDVVESVGGGTPDTKEQSYWEPAEYCWTTPRDLSNISAPVLLDTERKLSSKGVGKVSSGLLPAGTLLMSSRAPIGYLAITHVPMAINQGYIAILPESILPPLYMLFWCRQNLDTIKSHANGSTFMEISKKAFRPLPILVPPIQLIEHFVSLMDVLFERLVVTEKQAQSLANLRDTLLPRLISGQLQLHDVSEAIEEAVA